MVVIFRNLSRKTGRVDIIRGLGTLSVLLPETVLHYTILETEIYLGNIGRTFAKPHETASQLAKFPVCKLRSSCPKITL